MLGSRAARATLVAFAFVVALLLAAPGGHPATAGQPAAAAQAEPFRLYLGGIARDGAHLSVSISNYSPYQGGALLVSAGDSTSGTASLFGRQYPLTPDGAGGLAGFVGVGTEDPPGPTSLMISVVRSDGAPETVVRTLTVLKTDWTVDYIDLPPGVGDLLDPAIIKAEQDRLNAIYAGVSARAWSGAWRDPLPGPVTAAMVSGYFGEQRSFNGGPVGGHHGGTDFGVPAGTPVYSTNSGVAVLAEGLDVRGNMVIVDHGGGVFSGYAHMQALAVAPGEAVVAGQVIGYAGTTGLSTGPHLHWEMSVAGVLVDGLRWLDGTQGF
ncbi:MAG: M23 family metallopeptidase [Thermoflexaceae bacterium]|nr:M23 family metallopeptidase [Thermoflexaceae bacterium]